MRSGAVVEALEAEALDKKALSGINPYMPNLAATWMFQRSMTARPEDAQTGERTPNADFVNRLLRTNFDIMNDLGREVCTGSRGRAPWNSSCFHLFLLRLSFVSFAFLSLSLFF